MLYPLVSPSRPINKKMLSLCKQIQWPSSAKLHTVPEVSKQHQGVPVVPEVENLQTQQTSRGKESSQSQELNLDNFPMLGSVLGHKIRNSFQLLQRGDHNVNQSPRHPYDFISVEY